jgi:hypothetical protein
MAQVAWVETEAGWEPVEIGDDGYVGDEFVGDEFVGQDPVAQLYAMAGAAPRGGYAARWGAQRRGGPPARRQMGRGGPPPGQRGPSQAMQNALAERRANAGALLSTQGPTKAREYPMGLESAAPVGAGGSANVTSRPQVPFRVDRVVVPSDIAGLFVLTDLKVGKNSQFVSEQPVPARIFQENGVGVTLKGDTAQISQNVTMAVMNISGAASMFRAAVIGPAVE